MVKTTPSLANALGIAPGSAVLEIGWDDDCDEDLRERINAIADPEILDEDSPEVVDVVLLWWRDDDGDLVDGLMDAITPLTDHGTVWLFTPKNGREGHLEPADIAEAAPLAGLQLTSTISAAHDWNGTRLVAPRNQRGR